MSTKKKPQPITALKVRQWLGLWDVVRFDPTIFQQEPETKHFFLFSMKASHLKALTGVYRRSTKGGRARSLDPNVQRGHEEERSKIIRDFVQFGFPWCEMGEAKRSMLGADDLRKPGWLPTAILVNILPPGAERNGVEIPLEDLVKIEEHDQTATLTLPQNFEGAQWQPKKVFPLEVIDGQHRLWAFEDFEPGNDFELPVVAFYALDRGWQAYLFWSVNITPKKINRSLAFDLYPLLRQQSWLDKFAGHSIYRETRCQELTEALWSHPESPWYQRINMLGETKQHRDYKGPMVTQAAWVRSLMASFVKQWEGTGTKIGGLFGAPPSANDPLLPWNRPMQAAVLIFAGSSIKNQVKDTRAKWAKHLRETDGEGLLKGDDPAFYGEYSLLSTDQGIRGFLFVVNDLCFVQSELLCLDEWRWENIYETLHNQKLAATEEEAVTAAIKSFSKIPPAEFIGEISNGLQDYDWRTSSTPGLPERERLAQSVFRGSSGYKEMRRQLLTHLSDKGGPVSDAANMVIAALNY
jgi:DGQHR domain-containing protein